MFPVKFSLYYYLGIVTLFGICTVRITNASSIKSTVHIKEERPTGSFVVNVAELFKADKLKLSRRKFWFKMLSQKLKPPGSTGRNNDTTWVKLDSATGVIKTSRKIDRDSECAGLEQCVVHIQVIMLPQDSFGFLDLELFIDDVNDNAPNFSRDVIQIKISEAWRIGDSYNLDSFQAVDIDEGSNSKVTYDLSSNSYFTLSQTSGRGGSQHLKLVMKERLDHEREPSVRMILSAMDAGDPQMQSQVDLRVEVEDANDNSPTFDQEEYQITLLENSAPGMTVDTITARDEDSGILGEITYSISSRNDKLSRGLFAIDSRTGELKLREKVDREKHNGIRVLIEARDSDPVNHKTGEAWLLVNVEDVNDNAPAISIVFILHTVGNNVYISEYAAKGTFMFRVMASDADFGDNGEVSLSMEVTSPCAENADGKLGTFMLHPDGLVATVRPLDRELCDNYIMVITACDHGNPSKCSSNTINVTVLDENEFAPKFRASTQRVSVSENAALDTLVTTVRASDGDSKNGRGFSKNANDKIFESKNGVVDYSITSGGRGPFSVNRKTGAIRLHKPLDREEKSEWKITVTARDGAVPRSLESSCTVIITVSDVNDNAPRFLNPSRNNTMIYASTVSDQSIITLKADDLDSGKNGEVRFKLLSTEQRSKNASLHIPATSHNATGTFVLNPTTGEMKLNFSRRNLTNILGMHTVIIQAFDMGSPSKSSNLTVEINVIDYPVPLRRPGDLSSAAQDPILLAACAGSAFLLILIIITTVISLKCRKAQKESKSYSLPKDDVMEKDNDVMSLGGDTADGIQDSEYGDKSRITVTSRLMDEAAASTSRAECVPKLTREDMGYLTVARNIEMTSPAHSDGDSGRGDSETDGITCHKSHKEENSGQHITSALGANCTEQCMRLGHSDSCWMPLINTPQNVPNVQRQGIAAIPPHMHRPHPPYRVQNETNYVSRSPSRASNLDETAFMQRAPHDITRTGYERHFQAGRCMSPHRAMLYQHSPAGGYSSFVSPTDSRLTNSCLVLPRASVASTSNLLSINEKYGPSSSATNFLINYRRGNTKIDRENSVEKSLNPNRGIPTTSTAHMSPVNVPSMSPHAASPSENIILALQSRPINSPSPNSEGIFSHNINSMIV